MSDLPRGTVTFLFTDIEGSTRLWEDGRSTMSEALERHDNILQQAISDSGGVIFSTGGDGLAAAFERAPDALRAALDAQARLQSQTWDPPLSVRMAIHFRFVWRSTRVTSNHELVTISGRPSTDVRA